MNPQAAPEHGVYVVDAALAGLEDLDALPVAEHVARFAVLHDELTAALAGIDEV
ncbi:MAG: hypothetical protein M3R63_25215 [Actinomycetota bacterium]|nr:hypothetical protein [Actinomycetota bacterium]